MKKVKKKLKNLTMNSIFKRIKFIWDYYFVYFLYNGNKRYRYEQYIENKYGKSIK